MNCARVRDRMLLYLAGELEPPETVRLIRHLERCPSCASMLEGLAETAGQVEVALQAPVEAPATLDARVMDAVRQLPTPRRSWPTLFPRRRVFHRLALSSAVAALMVVSFIAGRWQGVVSHTGIPTTAALDLTLLGAAHRQALRGASASEVQADRPEELSQALAPLLPFAIAAVDLPAEGMRLRGGSRAMLQGVPVAALHYEWQRQRISLFQMDAQNLAPTALQQVVFRPDSYFVRKMNGLTYVTWSFGRTNCVLVARAVPMHLLFRLACHASEKLERA